MQLEGGNIMHSVDMYVNDRVGIRLSFSLM